MLASFRHQTDAEPSKLWEITQSCSVTEVGLRWQPEPGCREMHPRRSLCKRAVPCLAPAACSRMPAAVRQFCCKAAVHSLALACLQVEKGTFHLRVDTSTLVAVIAAKFTSVEMVREAAGGRLQGAELCVVGLHLRVCHPCSHPTLHQHVTGEGRCNAWRGAAAPMNPPFGCQPAALPNEI